MQAIIKNTRFTEAQNTLAELTGLCALSEFHFARAFRASFGLPPHRYLLRRRIQEALRQLPLSANSIASIAMNLGFSSQSHFTKVFREHTGMTPSDYRERIFIQIDGS